MGDGAASARLLDRAALLLRAGDFVGEFCAEHQESFAYPDATKKLFECVGRIRARTQEFVQRELARTGTDPQYLPFAESNLLTLANFWSALHRYIKPCADAHALIAPSPLLHLAKKRLGGVDGMEGADFVMLVTPDLNYEHHPDAKLTAINWLFRDRPFPSELGFLAMPYSMGATLFANVLLYHELGHFTYRRLVESSDDPAVTGLRDAISSEIAQRVPDFQDGNDSYKTRLVRVVDEWLKELFCDLFAIRLIGPAFSLAFWDFKNLLQGDEEEDNKFTSHPAPNARLQFQRQQLETDGWWPLLESNPQFAKVPALVRMRSVPAAESGNYSSDFNEAKTLLPPFFDCAPRIQKLVATVTQDVQSAAKAFDVNYESVSRLLANGIVPSYKLDASHGLLEEAVINSAYLFAQGPIEALEDRTAGGGDGSAAKRCRTLRRVDAWTLKAVEDLQYDSHK